MQLEFTGPSTDASGPIITYTAIPSSACTPTLSAIITDASGVNVSANNKPRLWFKRSGDATATVAASNDLFATGWKYVEASNSVSPFIFVMDYNLLDATPIAGTDSIRYFVVAQDLSGGVNVGNNVAVFTGGCPTSVALAGLSAATSSKFAVSALATSVTTNATNPSILYKWYFYFIALSHKVAF